MSADIHTLSPRPSSRKSKHAAPAAVIMHPAADDLSLRIAQAIAPLANQAANAGALHMDGFFCARLPASTADERAALGLFAAVSLLTDAIRDNGARHGASCGELAQWAAGLVGHALAEGARP